MTAKSRWLGVVGAAFVAAGAACGWEDESAPTNGQDEDDGAQPDVQPPIADGAVRDTASDAGDASPPLPTGTLAAGIYQPTSLSVDETHVWVVEPARDDVTPPKPNQVWKIGKADGKKDLVLRLPGSMVPAVALDGDAYWDYAFDSALNKWNLERRPKKGGKAEIVYSSTSGARTGALIVDDLNVYITAIGRAIPKAGWDAGTPPRSQSGIVSRAHTGWLYSTRTDWTVARHLPGTALGGEVIASAQAGAHGLFVDETGIYWTARAYGTVNRASHGGDAGTDSGAQELVFADGTEPAALAGDATHLYWAESGGRLRKVPKAGGAAVLVGSGVGRADELAVDDCCVYWIDRNAGVVRRGTK